MGDRKQPTPPPTNQVRPPPPPAPPRKIGLAQELAAAVDVVVEASARKDARIRALEQENAALKHKVALLFAMLGDPPRDPPEAA